MAVVVAYSKLITSDGHREMTVYRSEDTLTAPSVTIREDGRRSGTYSVWRHAWSRERLGGSVWTWLAGGMPLRTAKDWARLYLIDLTADGV